MEEKQRNQYGIILDGRMDEPVWDTLEEHTGFRYTKALGNGQLAEVQTSFKILPVEDRVYFGIKCMEPNMQQVIDTHSVRGIWETDRIELYIAPTGRSLDFYHFAVTYGGAMLSFFRIEEGRTTPRPYNPDWKTAVYTGEDFWSIEIEFPLTAFYMTPNASMSDTWAINMLRGRTVAPNQPSATHSSWCECERSFWEMHNFELVSGFSKRPAADDLRIEQAVVSINEETENGYHGIMTVTTTNAVADTFEFSCDHADTVTVALQAGANEIKVPCHFEQLNRYKVSLQLKRVRDGKIFKIYYPVTVTYMPIKLQFALPEYRCNFYPGQDCSKVMGHVTAAKPVTLKLEGPGIKAQIVTPDAEGNFTFETPDFEVGDAFLTATIDGYEKVQKIRRLAPTGHTMSWISGGNLIVNGKPVLRRDIYARYYRGGEAFDRKYKADDLHETKFESQKGWIQPCELVRGSEGPGGEATKDAKPSEQMLRELDKQLEANRDRDFEYYYPTDEPECRGVSPIYMKYFYEYIADKDPYHVILISSRSPDTLVDCSDWVETHPYICPHNRPDGSRFYTRPMNIIGGFVDKIAKLNRPDKCIGLLSTCYGGFAGGSDYPTFEEYICHNWAAMIRGGKTLWPYAYHDMNDRAALYEGTRYLFSSFEALEELVLLGKRTTLTKSTEAEAVLYELGDEKMFVLVNFTQEPKTVTLESISGTWHEFRHNRTITENTFCMKPLEVIIGTNTVKDADLPTYQETVALIDKQEYDRTHTGSLLYYRWADIEVTASGVKHLTRGKLFDGVWDNLAATVLEKPDNFLELDLTKVKPTFNKITIGGWLLENMELKLKMGDALIVPEILEEQNEEFSKTIVLKDAVTPTGLRLEFGGRKAELYEIAVF